MTKTERTKRDREAQKRRTRELILDAAVQLLIEGTVPSATLVAARAEVSRRTVYQYFPSQDKLVTDAALESVRARVDDAISQSSSADAEVRLRSLASEVLRSCIDNEVLMHAMVRLSGEQRLAELRAGGDVRAPLRGVRRIEWIESALGPVSERLDETAHNRLISALAVCIGFEALLVLRDIRGLDLAQMEDLCGWMATTLLHASLPPDS